MKFSLNAYAKINLGLDVLDLRPDGFHNIKSVFQTISLHDTIDLTVSDGNGSISLACSSDTIPSDDSNLVWKAARTFLKHTQIKVDVHIDLMKNIPTEAGLGGGSSDAAAVLTGLSKLTGNGIDLFSLALTLGSDVPFFLQGGAALIEGRGDVVSPIPVIPFHAVVIHPSIRVSTAWAYRELDSLKESLTSTGGCVHYSASSAVWHEGKPFPLNLRNDFLPLLRNNFSEIEELVQFFSRRNVSWGLSGSGPSLYALFRTESGAKLFIDEIPENIGYSLSSTEIAAGA